MNELEFKSTVYNVKFDGQQHQMRKPKAFELLKFQQGLKSLNNDPEKELIELVNFFSSLGLPKDVCEQMEVEHLLKLAEEISGASKKK